MNGVAAVAIARNVLSRIFASPLGLLSVVGTLAAWPLLTVVAPLGIRRSSSQALEWNYELAFMASGVGVVLATAARKRFDPVIELSAGVPSPLIDACVVAAPGVLFGVIALLPAILFGRAADSDLARWLPLLMVAAAWSALAMRLFSGIEAAAWSVALGTAFLPTILPTNHPYLRATAAAAALVLGAVLADHPPARKR
jgi:hypothetical protein